MWNWTGKPGLSRVIGVSPELRRMNWVTSNCIFRFTTICSLMDGVLFCKPMLYARKRGCDKREHLNFIAAEP